MKIVHIGKHYPPHFGGIESVTALATRGAAAAGHKTEVVCFGEPGEPDHDGSTRISRHAFRLLARQPLSAGYLFEAIRAGRRADIVHLHTPNMLGALAALFLGKKPRLVVHWHSDVVMQARLGPLLRPLEHALLLRADCIVSTSRPYADASPALQGFVDKIVILPIGVPDPLEGMARESSRASDLPAKVRDWIAGRPLVLSIGRLVEYKGYDVLVSAVSRMHSDAAVVVVGTGPLEQQLQQACVDAGIASRCLFAGRMSEAALRRLRESAAVFCLPSVSRAEAFGVVLVEAMAARCPAVATRIDGSGVPWVNSDGLSGINVPPRDPQALAEALDLILQDDALRERLAAGARARYDALFTERAFVRDLLALYEAIAAGAQERGSSRNEGTRPSR